MKKRLALGLSDYKQFREDNRYYVDKTLLIKDIEESGKAILIPRPRIFGKTLNLSMLYYFYTNAESSNEHLFVDTAIWKLPEYRKLQGTFPVIFISFGTITANNFASMKDMFQYVIAKEFSKHEYLLQGTTLNSNEKDHFERIRGRKATEVDVRSSLGFLVQILARYHKKKVILLIDDYDTPVQAAYLDGFYDEMMIFIIELLTGPFKDQTDLKKGIITGNFALTGLNYLNAFDITTSRMADRFGFTQVEVEELLTYYEFDSEQDDIRAWFNGYTFGKTKIFSPFSVLQCIDHKGLYKAYWAPYSRNLLLKSIIERGSPSIKDDLALLLQNKPIIKRIEESIALSDLDKDPNMVWSVLLQFGFLSYTQRRISDDKEVWFLIIPNKEIAMIIDEAIIDIFNKYSLKGDAKGVFVDIAHGYVESFSYVLQGFINSSMNAFGIKNHDSERSHHLFVLGILVMLKNTHDIASNTGPETYDVMIIPKNIESPGTIIEFKKVRSEETLETATQTALDQILAKNYQQELTHRGVQTIIAYGIAFENRSVRVKCMRIEKGVEQSWPMD